MLFRSAAGVIAAERPKFSLAALRRDGVMIPFASFDGRAWSLHWPEIGEHAGDILRDLLAMAPAEVNSLRVAGVLPAAP